MLINPPTHINDPHCYSVNASTYTYTHTPHTRSLANKSLIIYDKKMEPMGCATIARHSSDGNKADAKFRGNILGSVEFAQGDNDTAVWTLVSCKAWLNCRA